MEEIKYKKLVEHAFIPAKTNTGDAGYNIRAIERTIIRPYSLGKIRTGLAVMVPDGFELQIRGKTSMALDKGLAIAQGVGTIDGTFRDEIIVLLRNIQPVSKIVEAGDPIAQFVLNKVPEVEWKEVKNLELVKERNPSTKKEEMKSKEIK